MSRLDSERMRQYGKRDSERGEDDNAPDDLLADRKRVVVGACPVSRITKLAARSAMAEVTVGRADVLTCHSNTPGVSVARV